jgi:hypothetical protein
MALFVNIQERPMVTKINMLKGKMNVKKRLNCDEMLPEPIDINDFDNPRNLTTCLRMPNSTAYRIAREDIEIAARTGLLKSNREIMDIQLDKTATSVC